MLHRLSYLTTISTILLLLRQIQSEDPIINFVNPFIGTSYFIKESDVHDYGNTIPQVGAPFAHTPWTPQTRHDENKCTSPYYYFDKMWEGMRRTHWIDGSCTIDYGSASVLPSLNASVESALVLHKLEHSNEIATIASYEVDLPESSLHLKSSSYQRAGIMQVNSMNSSKGIHYYLIFVAFDTMYNDSSVRISSTYGHNDTVFIDNPAHRWYQGKGQGAGFSGHHVFISSRSPLEVGIIEGYTDAQRSRTEGKSSSRGPVAAYMKFDYEGGPVTISTACSFVSAAKALQNLQLELVPSDTLNGAHTMATVVSPDIFNIDALIGKVEKAWSDRLDIVNLVPHQHNRTIPNADRATVRESNNLRVNEEEALGAEMFKIPPIGKSGDKLAGSEILTTVYTALWHSLLLPRTVSDYDGEYLSFGADGVRSVKNTTAGGFSTYYDDFSMWDIFRAQVPLLNLAYTDVVRDMVASLVAKAEDGGWLPIFPAWNSHTGEMIGDHCTVFLADAFIKGSIPLKDADGHINSSNIALLEKAAYYSLKNAFILPLDDDYKSGKGRRALKSYLKYGFIPLEDTIPDSPHPGQQVSRTLEYAYDDFVVSQLLQFYVDNVPSAYQEGSLLFKQLLKDANLPSVQEAISLLSHRSKTNYKLVVDSKGVGFVRGRYANLSWAEDPALFNPGKTYPWLTETTVWQYTWAAMHDIEGMIDLYGGNDNFTRKLDTFFESGWYNHGNEPDHHALYLYPYVPRQTWKLQKRLPGIVRAQYGPTERGLPGNEDAGQMSAWLVLSALGFYQVCPGCGNSSEYVLGAPLFAHAEVRLSKVGASSSPGDFSTLHGPSTGKGGHSLRILRVDAIRGALRDPGSNPGVPVMNPGIGREDTSYVRFNDIDDISMSEEATDAEREGSSEGFQSHSSGKEAWYVQQAFWNGCEYNCAFFSHDMLSKGGHLLLFLGLEPNKSWGGNGRQCMQEFDCKSHPPNIHPIPHIRPTPQIALDGTSIIIISAVISFVITVTIATLVYILCLRSRLLGYSHMAQNVRNFRQPQGGRGSSSDANTYYPSGALAGQEDVDETSHSVSGSATL